MDDAPFRHLLEQAWAGQNDPAHDMGHVTRVVALCRRFAVAEGGDARVLVPAAWLHDLINLPKNHPDRARASVLSADAACAALRGIGYGDDALLDAIHHAIVAHSFSANVPPRSLEAKILQDADRMDALGAIGIARCFAVSGVLGRALFDPADPLARARVPDDVRYGLDHFQVKLFKIAETLHTDAARAMARERVAFMQNFAAQIARETETGEAA